MDLCEHWLIKLNWGNRMELAKFPLQALFVVRWHEVARGGLDWCKDVVSYHAIILYNSCIACLIMTLIVIASNYLQLRAISYNPLLIPDMHTRILEQITIVWLRLRPPTNSKVKLWCQDMSRPNFLSPAVFPHEFAQTFQVQTHSSNKWCNENVIFFTNCFLAKPPPGAMMYVIEKFRWNLVGFGHCAPLISRWNPEPKELLVWFLYNQTPGSSPKWSKDTHNACYQLLSLICNFVPSGCQVTTS